MNRTRLVPADLAPARASRWSIAQPWVSTVVRLALAGIWIVAGGLKVTDTNQAVLAVRAYQLLPAPLEVIVGFGLPLFEIALGLLLLVGLLTRPVAIISAVVFVVFIAGVASAWARGLAIDCGCFGGGGNVAPDQTQYVSEILRDLGFLAMAVFVAIFPRSRISLDSRFDAGDQ